MPDCRSWTTTRGRTMAGARALWRATGMKEDDFNKPIVAVSNSFTQFVPGHVHLKDMGQLVAREIEKAGGVAKEFNTIAVDDVKKKDFFRAAPEGVPTQTAFSQSKLYKTLDDDRENGCIRSKNNAYSQDGGLAVLYGNIAQDGCIVKTAGVDESILKFTGRARIFHSQDAAVDGILGNTIEAGDVVVITHEGPRGGPGMQEILYPTTYLKSKKLGKACALVTDGRFSGGTSGLSIGHVSPEAAEGGAIGLVEENDTIEIDIPNRKIHLAVDEATLEARRAAMEARGKLAWKPQRDRVVSTALKAYGALATSAAFGAVRDVDALK